MAVRVTKGVLLGGLLLMLLVGTMRGATASAGSSDQPIASRDDAYQRVVARTMADLRCTTGRAPDPGPSSALVRTAAGNVRVVSFEHGWDVYNGRRPGTLVAVCLDAAEPELLSVQSG